MCTTGWLNSSRPAGYSPKKRVSGQGNYSVPNSYARQFASPQSGQQVNIWAGAIHMYPADNWASLCISGRLAGRYTHIWLTVWLKYNSNIILLVLTVQLNCNSNIIQYHELLCLMYIKYNYSRILRIYVYKLCINNMQKKCFNSGAKM